jgi:hypothetical protein
MDEIAAGFKTLILSVVKPSLNGKNFNNVSTDVTEQPFGGMVTNAIVERNRNILSTILVHTSHCGDCSFSFVKFSHCIGGRGQLPDF